MLMQHLLWCHMDMEYFYGAFFYQMARIFFKNSPFVFHRTKERWLWVNDGNFHFWWTIPNLNCESDVLF